MCVNRGALFVSPKSIDSFGKRDGRGGKNRGRKSKRMLLSFPFLLLFLFI